MPNTGSQQLTLNVSTAAFVNSPVNISAMIAQLGGIILSDLLILEAGAEEDGRPTEGHVSIGFDQNAGVWDYGTDLYGTERQWHAPTLAELVKNIEDYPDGMEGTPTGPAPVNKARLNPAATLIEPQTEGDGLKWAATIVKTEGDDIQTVSFGRLWDNAQDAKEAAARQIKVIQGTPKP